MRGASYIPGHALNILILLLLSRCHHSLGGGFHPAFARCKLTSPSGVVHRTRTGRIDASSLEPENSRFGRQDYWNAFYEEEANFTWYAGWDELQPFVQEFVDTTGKILIPGVGNDAMLVDMYDDGFQELIAMDYAPEGIARCRDLLGPTRVWSDNQDTGVVLVVADARNLTGVFNDDSFDVVIEKGTLDAIYLSGGQDKMLADRNLNLAISELGRCVKPGGIWISIAAVVDNQIQASFDTGEEWSCLVKKDDLYTTSDGYTSNNIDGSLMVWQRKEAI